MKLEMKTFNQILIITISVIFLIGCAVNSEDRANMKEAIYEKEMKDSIAVAEFLSSTAAKDGKDTTRKFIRTADIKFRVKDVRMATFKIEDIITALDGFVTYTNLNSNVDRTTIVPVSADSSLESIYYSVVNDMVIRVPNTKLDSSLKAIAKLVDYLDYRIIKAEDVSLDLIANQMKGKRLNDHEKRLTNAIDNRGKKLIETTITEEDLLNKQMLTDKTKLNNMSMQDQVAFSTININIYQRQDIKRALILNDRNIESYTPGIFHRIKDAIESGWKVLEHIFVFIAQMWSVILLGIIVFVILRKVLQMKN